MKKVLIISLLLIAAASSYAQRVTIRSMDDTPWYLVMYQHGLTNGTSTYSTQSHYRYEGGSIVFEEFEESKSNGRYITSSGNYNQGVYYMNFFGGKLHNVYIANLFGGTGRFYIGEIGLENGKRFTYWNHGILMTDDEVNQRYASNDWGLMIIEPNDDFTIVIE